MRCNKKMFYQRTGTNYSQGHIKPGPRPFMASYVPIFKDADSFIEAKIKMLKKDFCIDLSEEDKTWLHGFKTEGEINAAVRKLVDKYWNME